MLSEEGDAILGEQDRKYVCTVCNKCFNRPSSLRIHVNTHTGATPFRCPFPGCGREFNVNSNMRRHYRNHTNPGATSSGPAHSSSSSLQQYPSSSPLHSYHPYQKRHINIAKCDIHQRHRVLRPLMTKRSLGTDFGP
ncbi:hypothetical protein DFS33DRAFT_1463469 [Desarmillaria ectypa]|nr:hypothetical protein DFS33DRAFT_1463469 [Desarmillaria ectypa]